MRRMQYISCLFIFISIMLSSGLASHCVDHVLAATNLRTCKSDTCEFHQVVNQRIFLAENTDLCIRLDSDGVGMPQRSYRLSILSSKIIYDLLDCYTASDTIFTITGECCCYLGCSLNDSSCPASPADSGYNFRFDDFYAKSDCFFGVPGEFCARLSFRDNGIKYRVCEVGSPRVELLVQSDTPEGSKAVIINLNQVETEYHFPGWNITFFPEHLDNKIESKFIIKDVADNENFYLLKNKFVNDIQEYDFNKLGWYRPDSPPALPLPDNRINAYPRDCVANDIWAGITTVTFEDRLRKEDYYNKVREGALLFFEDAVPAQGSSGSSSIRLEPLESGTWLRDTNNQPFPFGVIAGGIWPHNSKKIENLTIRLLDSGVYTGEIICSNYFVVRNNENLITEVRECALFNTGGLVVDWGWCRRGTDASVNPIQVAEYCDNPSQTQFNSSIMNSPGIFLIRNSAGSFTLEAVRNEGQQPNELIVNPTVEDISIKAELIGLSVTVQSSDVSPEITNLEDRKDSIEVFFKSKNNQEGQCLLGSDQQVLETRSVTVKKEETSVFLSVAIHQYKGKIVITLKCDDDSDSMSMDIDVHKGTPDIETKTVSDEEVREKMKEDSNRKSSDWWVHFTGKEWIDQVLSVVFYLVAAVAGVFLSYLISRYLLWPLTKWLLIIITYPVRKSMIALDKKLSEDTANGPQKTEKINLDALFKKQN